MPEEPAMMSDKPEGKSVYLVGRNVVSIYHLLERFADPQYIVDGIPRISDLHLKIGEPARYRFDGELLPLPDAAPLSPEVIADLLFPLLSESHISQLTAPDDARDIDASFEWGERRMSFRINAFHDRDGLACAIRVLPRTIPPLSRIGFPDEKVWRDIAALRQGLVLVSGVTGSGKSTTIASLVQHINRNSRTRILTLEDPIEYVIHSERALVSQREIGKHVSSFQEGLRSGLREDPDVIFVGEIRDSETAALALTAAETGHLVVSTLHTRDAKGAVSRLVDLFPPDRTKEVCAQVSFALEYVVGQKLVPRADGPGCRVAMEVMRGVPAIANQIRNGNWHQIYSTMETHHKDGLYTLERHLMDLIVSGDITKETALQFANNLSPFQT